VPALWRPCAVITAIPSALQAARTRKLNARLENGAPEYPEKIKGENPQRRFLQGKGCGGL